jgi:Rrf2 family nitric oxide-sensitive transcriptional repressor
VVRALEDRQALVECFRSDGGDCSLTPRCRLKSKLKAAEEVFLRELDKTALSECAVPVRATAV